MNHIVPHMRTREDLLKYVSTRCPIATFKRCFDDTGASIINLGAFDPLPGYGKPGWILKFVTKFGVTRYLAVPATRAWMWEIKTEIDWDNYVGGKSKLYAGDINHGTNTQRKTDAVE